MHSLKAVEWLRLSLQNGGVEGSLPKPSKNEAMESRKSPKNASRRVRSLLDPTLDNYIAQSVLGFLARTEARECHVAASLRTNK